MGLPRELFKKRDITLDVICKKCHLILETPSYGEDGHLYCLKCLEPNSINTQSRDDKLIKKMDTFVRKSFNVNYVDLCKFIRLERVTNELNQELATKSKGIDEKKSIIKKLSNRCNYLEQQVIQNSETHSDKIKELESDFEDFDKFNQIYSEWQTKE